MRPEDGIPAEFRTAAAALSRHRPRPEIGIEQTPAPQRIAPYTMAFTGTVSDDLTDSPPIANGRFVLLFDPAGQAAWSGRFRVVSLVRATLDPEMATDELLAEVAWSWLTDALAETGAKADAVGGTVTRVLSQSFGALDSHPSVVDIEIRASWTPRNANLGHHVAAWTTLLATAAGLPPLADGVTPLRVPRTVGP